SISMNDELGIDLGDDGVTLNDPKDPDIGANNLQNFPVLSSIFSDGTTTVITGTLNSDPNLTGFVLEFFASSSPDPSGFGEGETFFGNGGVNTDSNGDGSFSVTFPNPVAAGTWFTATATNPTVGTSEFSQAVQSTGVGPRPSISINDVSMTEGNSGTKTLTFTAKLSSPSTSPVT